MPNPARSHRWILALPALLAVVGLTLHEGMARPPVANLLGDAPQTRIQADVGAEYEQHDDAIDLRSGNLLVDASGFATVHAGAWDVHVWGGSAYVSVQRDRLTVAALDVPVMVRGEYGT